MFKLFLTQDSLKKLVENIVKRYRLVYPTLVEGVITYKEWKGEEIKLPNGVREFQMAGFYRLEEGIGSYVFKGWTHGMNSPKEFLHPKRLVFLKLDKDLNQEVPEVEGRFAFFGIRNCDLNAVRILDKVFKEDYHYNKFREDNLFIVANCVEPSNTCFCTSVGGSPFGEEGFDLSITELEDGFLISVGSQRGMEVLEGLSLKEATQEQLQREEELYQSAVASMKKLFDLSELPAALLGKMESSHWEFIEKRCLACGSCTMVCPTCFCYEVIDDFSSESQYERVREWDSCFRLGFSETHHIPIRKSIASRYRQWLLHKFSYWFYQFSTLGCVGCGRCITWCPVGIDVREEVRRTLNAQ
ncbi:4Fe-4S dicluster domain-containing protein [Thermocrinis sp.]